MKKNYFFSLLSVICFNTLSFAQVFITELADPNDNPNARYIELYNAGSSQVDLTDWRIDKYTNANATVSQSVNLTGTIDAGSFYIIATGPEDTVVFDTWGVTPDQWDPEQNHVAGSNGDDNLELYNASGTLIDQFGVPGEDGTGTDHEFEDGRAERKPTITGPNPTWDVNEWNIDNDGGAGNGAINTEGFDPRAWVGTLTNPLISRTGSVNNLTYFEGKGPSEEDSFSVSGINLTSNITVTAPSNFEVSLTTDTGFSDVVTVSQTSGEASAKIYVRLKAGLSVNTYSGDVTATASGATAISIAVTGEVEPATPQFNVTAFLDDFNYILSEGGPSPEDDFTVSGDNLTADLVITAPENFEVSLTTGTGFASSVSLTPDNEAIDFTDIFVRLKSGLTIGSYSGSISVTTTGVDAETIAVNGNVFGAATKSLIITGVFDGPLSGGIPKGVELYALANISDLSLYGVSSATNGNGSSGNIGFSFPNVVVEAGEYIYVTNNTEGFTEFFGALTTDFIYQSGVVNINGDDAIELYENGQIIDVFGDVDTDGSGEAWDYLDGWAYRNNNSQPSGQSFNLSEWTFSGINVFDGETINSSAETPFPSKSFTGTLSTKNNSINGFTLYPNPVNDNQFTIGSASSETKQVSIFNVLGKQVFNTSFTGISKSLQVALSSGVYVLKVTEKGKVATQKLIIK